jgi:hypothetical protein
LLKKSRSDILNEAFQERSGVELSDLYKKQSAL